MKKMEFNKAYNRQEFVNFLQNSFLPEDFLPAIEPVSFRTKMTYNTQAVKLGSSEKLDLVVYEVRQLSEFIRTQNPTLRGWSYRTYI